MGAWLRVAAGGALLMLGGAGADSAAPSSPAVTTWKLNVPKSRFTPGPGWRSQIRTYRHTPAGMSVTWTGIGAKGEPMRVSFTIADDGSDTAMHGSANYDTLNSVRVDALTTRSQEKRAGKVVGIAVVKRSPDGKVMTITDEGTDRKGIRFAQLLVFDRQ